MGDRCVLMRIDRLSCTNTSSRVLAYESEAAIQASSLAVFRYGMASYLFGCSADRVANVLKSMASMWDVVFEVGCNIRKAIHLQKMIANTLPVKKNRFACPS